MQPQWDFRSSLCSLTNSSSSVYQSDYSALQTTPQTQCWQQIAFILWSTVLRADCGLTDGGQAWSGHAGFQASTGAQSFPPVSFQVPVWKGEAYLGAFSLCQQELLKPHFCSHPIGQSKSQGQSQGQCGRGLHKNTDAWKPDTLELLIAAVWHRSQKWKSQRAIRRLYNNTERNDDGLHRGDDNGSFKKCLDSEYSWKNDLICILLSH